MQQNLFILQHEREHNRHNAASTWKTKFKLYKLYQKLISSKDQTIKVIHINFLRSGSEIDILIVWVFER